MDEREIFSRSAGSISFPQKRPSYPSPLSDNRTTPARFRQASGGKMKTKNDIKGRNRPSSVLILFLLFFLVAIAAKNGSAAGQRLTLDEAVRIALKDNHELQAQRNANAAKEAEVGIARSFLLPRISLEERYLRTGSPVYSFMTRLNQQRIGMADFAPETLNHPAAVNDFQTAITLEQPLFVKKAGVGIEMSRVEAAASEEALQRKKEETKCPKTTTLL